MSRSILSRMTAREGDPGISVDTITKLESDPNRQPADRTILLLGEALGATGDEFPAYELAKARARFDERRRDFASAWRSLQDLRRQESLD
jgi:hypothetical protein